jgi:hypothetical protein
MGSPCRGRPRQGLTAPAPNEFPDLKLHHQHLAQPELAREISHLLVAASATEFLSHPELIFEPDRSDPQFSDVLGKLEVVLAGR